MTEIMTGAREDELEAFMLHQNTIKQMEKQASIPVSKFEYLPKNSKVNLRVSDELLTAVKAKAAALNMPYQRFIRQMLEQQI